MTQGGEKMHQTAANTGIELIDRDECLALLRADEIGRLAVIDGGRPVIFPVNYVLDAEDIVFRTAPGTKVEQGPRAPACFEIDGFDRPHRAGWSVVVTGRLEEVTAYNGSLFAHARELPVHPWADGPKDHIMRLVPATITGRRIRGS
ncbi:MAG: pyridoxamine 5'-phosphate oxidase family protein [Acidimicrobiales bacterium]